MEIKTELNKWDLMKHKNFCTEGNHKQDEKTTHKMGEKFAKEATEKGLSYKIYKQLMQVNIKKTNNPI